MEQVLVVVCIHCQVAIFIISIHVNIAIGVHIYFTVAHVVYFLVRANKTYRTFSNISRTIHRKNDTTTVVTSLVINQRSLHHQPMYKHHLQRAYTKSRYIAILRAKFGWSDPLVETIAWKCLSSPIKQIHRELLITKCCNTILPPALKLKTSIILISRKRKHGKLISSTAPPILLVNQPMPAIEVPPPVEPRRSW